MFYLLVCSRLIKGRKGDYLVLNFYVLVCKDVYCLVLNNY